MRRRLVATTTTVLLLAAGTATAAASVASPATASSPTDVRPVAGPAVLPTVQSVGARAAAEPRYGRLVLVLDSSGSMAERAAGGQTKINAAKTALRTVVDELPDEAEVGLRVFGSRVFSRTDPGACEDTEVIVEPGTGNRDELRQAISAYRPYGETPIPRALEEAARDLGADGARSIVLVSDGESTCGDPCEVARTIAGQGIDLRIDVVGLSVTAKARAQLECIARAGDGTYYDADSAEDIELHVTQLAERALRPFTIDGTPIQGGPETDPTPITVGDWVDTLDGDESKSYLFERTTTGTTLRVAAYTQGEQGNSESLTTELFDADGDRCDYAIVQRNIDTRRIIGSGATGWAENECDQPGLYRITVARGRTASEQVALGLRVTEEPALTDPGFSPPAAEIDVVAPQAGGPVQAVVGGASFDNAAEIGPGRWSSTAVPGEAPLFAIPLDFGQAARISVEFPELSRALADVVGRFPPLAGLTVYSPMRSQIPHPRGATFSAPAAEETLLTATAAVSRAEGDTSGAFDGGGDHTTAGTYYVGVSLRDAGIEESVEFPFTINVEIVGDPAAGPTYADDVTWSVEGGLADAGDAVSPSEDVTDVPAGDDPSRTADEDEASGTSTALAVAVGAAGTIALLGAVLLWRRRRATR